MSTTVLVNSVINKLKNQNNKNLPLIFNSDSAVNKQKELKNRILELYIAESSFIVLGTFLQNINLNLFTQDELKILLSFDYASINSNKVLPNNSLNNLKAPYYDLNNTIINMSYLELSTLNSDFKKLHSINKSLNIEYLISYLVNQI